LSSQEALMSNMPMTQLDLGSYGVFDTRYFPTIQVREITDIS